MAHNYTFDVEKWDVTQARRVQEEEHLDLMAWLVQCGYKAIANKLAAEYSVYTFLRFECEQLRRGTLSVKETDRLSDPTQDILA